MIVEFKKKTGGNDDIKGSNTKRGGLDLSKKSRVPVFASIGDALAKHDYGTMFTTPKADRIYVVTKGTWGQKSKDKVVKGFGGGTAFNKIKAYSLRTKVKHGGTKTPVTSQQKAKQGYATKKVKNLQKRKEPLA